MDLFFLDFEVFRYNWLVVVCDVHNHRFIEIIDDKEQLEKFYNEHKKDIFIGFNIKHYDQYIFKSILTGYNPFDISNWIVNLHLAGWNFAKDINNIPMNIYDVQFEKSHGLKYYEASMGHSIVESEISFDIDRKLTQEEIQETLKYCRNDVEETIRIFIQKFDDFKAHCQMLSMFNMPLKNIKKTKVQLSSNILGAYDVPSKNEIYKRATDEFDIDFPNTLILDKYINAKKWYEDRSNRTYEKTFEMLVAGIVHQFGWGGLHGALENYCAEGNFLMFDVASLYPSLIIEYGLLSRYAKMEHYKDIVRKRLEYKRAGNSLQAPLKIIANGTYGAMKDCNNALYDPLQANRVCVYGQLLLLDLIEKIENYGLIVNTNTDGILIKIKDGCEQNIMQACDEWQKRTRLKLDFKKYTKVFQANVNSYCFVDTEGKTKTKGAYVKKLTNLNYELAILSEAIIKCLVDGVDIEKTIGECNDLRKFQMIKRTTANYPTLFMDNEKIDLNTVRIFASVEGGELFKKHKNGSFSRVEGLPECVQMINVDIENMPIPEWLDRQWYIDEAKRRMLSFISKEK